ncbi:MAG: DUF192 domain-containing protein [Bryobacteraceae bacterium]|jgi:uncharacterized membrane protein (UPF0127 family)
MAWKLPRMCGLALALALGAALALNGCGGGSSESLKALNRREVKLPDGQIIQAETALGPEEMQRGLMFRESLAPDRGMLFVHNAEGQYPYWMYQCKISLDMIWMDRQRRIVEIAEQVPPCPPGPQEQCPNYGGHEPAMFVLELAAGEAARHGLKNGQVIEF